LPFGTPFQQIIGPTLRGLMAKNSSPPGWPTDMGLCSHPSRPLGPPALPTPKALGLVDPFHGLHAARSSLLEALSDTWLPLWMRPFVLRGWIDDDNDIRSRGKQDVREGRGALTNQRGSQRHTARPPRKLHDCTGSHRLAAIPLSDLERLRSGTLRQASLSMIRRPHVCRSDTVVDHNHEIDHEHL